MVTSRE